MLLDTKRIFFWIVFIGLFLSACSPSTEATPTSTPLVPAPTANAATATPKPIRELTICLGHEPNTLYIHDNPNPAAISVLEAIYDGPLDSRNYDYQPVSLQRVPSLAQDDASIISVPVSEGDWVIDAEGNLIELIEGIRVYPAGCQTTSCIITYKKDMNLEMDEMVVNFSFLGDMLWPGGWQS